MKPPKQGLQAWRKDEEAAPWLLLSALLFPACAHGILLITVPQFPLCGMSMIPTPDPARPRPPSLTLVTALTHQGGQVPEAISFASFPVTSDFLLWDLEPASLPSMR